MVALLQWLQVRSEDGVSRGGIGEDLELRLDAAEQILFRYLAACVRAISRDAE
jgi:hypothetical protein